MQILMCYILKTELEILIESNVLETLAAWNSNSSSTTHLDQFYHLQISINKNNALQILNHIN